MVRAGRPVGDGRRAATPGLPLRALGLALLVPLVVVAAVLIAVSRGGDDDATIPASPAATAAVPAPRVDRFDADRAFALLRAQVALGPRPAGSAVLRRLAVRLRARLPEGRFEAVPGHRGLRNVVGVLPGRRPAVLVAAHYDTQPLPRGFVGANDSAAGTAAVVEVARALAGEPASAEAREVRFVVFDGEELPRAKADSADFEADALRGSKAYATAHAGEVGQLVLLDYIAGRGVRLPREGTSDRRLWARLRAAAGRVGTRPVFPPARGIAITDDHTPFLRAGVPAIDLIDWAYPVKNTARDRLDRVSKRSLDAVGETVLELVRELRG
jgi:glutaminyl-peptide cyclotransferase